MGARSCDGADAVAATARIERESETGASTNAYPCRSSNYNSLRA
jgi:hypothetical protein